MNALLKRSIALGTAFTLALIFSQTVAAQTTLSGTMTADNEFDLYISTDDSTAGSLIVTDTDWTTAYTLPATALTPGVTNYIHFVARNVTPPPLDDSGNPAMLIGEFSLSDSQFEFANGTQTLLTNPTDWKVSPTGWSGYGTPSDLGADGTAPWGDIAGVNNTARFLWDPAGQTTTPVYFTAAIIPVDADIKITSVENSADPVIAGSGSSDFTFTVANLGPANATNVVADFSATITGGVWNSTPLCTYTPSAGTFAWPTWTIPTIANGASVTIQEVCPADSDSTDGANRELTLSLTSLDQPDPDDGNNSATEDATIAREVKITIEKKESIDPVVAGSGGGNLEYKITATNNGPSDVDGLVVSEVLTLPTGVTLVSVVPDAGNWSSPNWTVDLASGASESLIVTLTVAPNAVVGTDTISDTATVTGSGGGEDILNIGDDSATATESTSVAREVEIQLTKGGIPDPVVAGSGPGNLTYTVTATNNGPSDVTDLVVSDVFTLPANVSVNSVTPSNGLPAWSAPNWTVSLASGEFATLTVVITVPLTADEGVDVVGDEAEVDSSGGGETITNLGEPSASAALFTDIRWPEATFRVSKEYEEGGSGPAVDVTLTCTDTSGLLVYAPQQGTTQTSLTVRRFDIFGATTSCTVTETVPNGFYEVDRTTDCDVTAMDGASNGEGDGVYACTITNAQTLATFHVTKDFVPDNSAEVEVFISCNDGLPLKSDQVLNEDSGGVTYVVEIFTAGNLDCEITEVPVPSGYDDSYVASTVDGEAGSLGNTGGCQFEEVVSGDFACVITNTAQPATFTVTKIWEVIAEGGDLIPQEAEILIWCTKPFTDLSDADDSGFDGLFWARKELTGNGSFHVDVATKFEGAVRCNAVETTAGFDDAVEQTTTCSTAPSPNASWTNLDPGGTGGCSFTNTVFFEGIPTLNQYGLALMALLMLGIGAVGLRRFV